jgi:glycosyltransferase involved in cell wall biosynthesis
MRISIVLPAYNESAGLARCLDSIARQTVAPYEVIVVDNNSTDDTVLIAKRYNFVTVLSEKEQGITPATQAGFAAARGDIIARFNADVALEDTWVEKTIQFFGRNPTLDGMTGVARTPIFPHAPGYSTMWATLYSLGVEVYLGAAPVWGGNYALRSHVAKNLIKKLAHGPYHDDIDLGLWLAHEGSTIRRVGEPVVTTDEVSYGYFFKMLQYFQRTIRTKRLHIEQAHYPLPPRTRLTLLDRAWRLAICAVPLALYMVISLVTIPIYIMKAKLVQ